MKCPYCLNPIEEHDLKFMVGIERPYMNIMFHRSCISNIKDLLSFLQEKWELIVSLRKETDVKKKK